MKNTLKRTLTMLLAIIFLVSCTVVFSACDKKTTKREHSNTTEDQAPSSEEMLIGKWELISGSTDNEKMTLYSDGICLIGNESGTWKVEGTDLIIMGGYSGRFWNHDNFAAEFSLSGDRLTIDYYGGIVYKKVDKFSE